MKSSPGTERSTFRFALSVQDPSLKDLQVRELVAKATRNAVKAARLPDLQISTDLEGGFGGLGEATVVLAISHAAKAAAAAAGVGFSTAAGKFFFETYLAPRLRKLNLLPTGFHPIKELKKAPERSKEKELKTSRHR